MNDANDELDDVQKAEASASLLAETDPTGDVIKAFLDKLREENENVFTELVARCGECEDEGAGDEEEVGGEG